MAERNYRRDDKIRQTGRYAYIDGSTVRKLQTRPVPEKRETERRQEQPRRRKRTSAKTRRNRARALQMHLRDVIFLGIAGMIVVVSCINYLQKQALNTSRPLIVVPGTFLGGAVFFMLSDLIARTAFAPLELNISTVTSIFGAPVVIAMMLKRQKGKQ